MNNIFGVTDKSIYIWLLVVLMIIFIGIIIYERRRWQSNRF